MAPILGYWKIRGLAQHIRLLLEYVGESYEEKLYVAGPPPNYESEWFTIKYNLGLKFPNLPYFIDGDVKITQSNAIMRHVARKHSLCGVNEQEQILVDILENQAMDMRMAYVKLVYAEYNTKLKEYVENLKKTLKTLSEALGKQKWFVGDKITFPDFLFYELLDIHRELERGCLDAFPNLVDFMKRFEDLPNIKKYMASSRFMKSPLNGPMAIIGGK